MKPRKTTTVGANTLYYRSLRERNKAYETFTNSSSQKQMYWAIFQINFWKPIYIPSNEAELLHICLGCN